MHKHNRICSFHEETRKIKNFVRINLQKFKMIWDERTSLYNKHDQVMNKCKGCVILWKLYLFDMVKRKKDAKV